MAHPSERTPSRTPSDWPKTGPIDLAVHDLPHASAATEWWYWNCHLETADGRSLALFASFFRIARPSSDPKARHAHALTWALSDLDGSKYYADSLLDRNAPEIGLEKLERGEGWKDERLRRAIREVLKKGKIPYPDRMFRQDPFVGTQRLELEFDDNRLCKNDDGSYQLRLVNEQQQLSCDLTLTPHKAPVRHGRDGVVQGVHGEDMFYYFVPRLAVRGTVSMAGRDSEIREGSAWYDHEFGGNADSAGVTDTAWDWVAIQLADGSELTAYRLTYKESGGPIGSMAVLIDKEGQRRAFDRFTLELKNEWRSHRTFNDYPTKWHFSIPEIRLELDLDAAFDDQEFVTLINKSAFWEGRVDVRGTIGHQSVKGNGFVERSGYSAIRTLDDFFGRVGESVRKSIEDVIPLSPTYEQARDLLASKERDHYMQGVDIPTLVKTMVRPVREIADRGGKSWRSYAALACCDVVGGDSRRYMKWLALPELMHVGSLIIDDVQDKSTVRRGGPTCHLLYGEPLAINAGTAAYFMAHDLLYGTEVSNADKLRLYHLYFETLRAAHGGQALDIAGVYDLLPEVVRTGDSELLEQRVLAAHRLKTAAPAASLARMGALVGGGSELQIEAVGRYMEAVALAFQIIDDVLNLRGFKGDLKSRGEDLSDGKVTLPVAEAMGRLGPEDRHVLWDIVRSQPKDRETLDRAIGMLETSGALDACVEQARVLVEQAWSAFDPTVEESIVKIMLRAFGWYVLERHY